MNAGILCAFVAFALWGLFPVYFKALQTMTPSGPSTALVRAKFARSSRLR